MQTTLKSTFTMVGSGLHSGRPARLRVMPAPADFGVEFRRVDVTDMDNRIPARFSLVNDTQLCTRLSNEAGVEIATVEHLMAALAGCGVHNAIVEIDGPEVPIMDGSAARFVKEILSAGVVELHTPVKVLRILKTISVSEADAFAELSPSEDFEIDFEISFADKAIGQQKHTLNMKNGSFVRELSDCRTFCMFSDVEYMKSIGLARGGSLANAVVIDDGKVLNPEGYRRVDECVRHKMLDALGDLALAGVPVIGRYHGIRAGHRMTNLLLRAVFSAPDSYEIVEVTHQQSAHLPGVGISNSVLEVAV
ncbi:UDP-3-O-[3-hydroxymyristoyl] N-acetylglucosamine deacetylase [Rhodobacterales bacterium 52_120_T64]|nr:UDP-3-O-[3-hydroxymyristoyl] N-acetylglucosamine deacetylase [Rhodobacterales bacterium 52_120_T64]